MTSATNAGNNPRVDQRSTMPPQRRVGLGARGERMLDVAGVVVLAVFALSWTWSIAHANAAGGGDEVPQSATRTVSAALTTGNAPTAAYVTDAAMEALAARARGTSGRLRVKIVLPGEIDEALKAVANFTQITLTPFSAKERGRVGLYFIGSWPGEHGARGPSKAPPDRYANPRGFIQVTQQNETTHVSQHFRFKDFLTHDQQGVWPKYLVLEIRNVDKLELVMEDLETRGVNTAGVVVMSGFRTPQYNAGGGNTGGRAGLSRHMYGDAADIYIDNDHNGAMDDLNRDGRVDAGDSRYILESVERVERQHPELVGGGRRVCSLLRARTFHSHRLARVSRPLDRIWRGMMADQRRTTDLVGDVREKKTVKDDDTPEIPGVRATDLEPYVGLRYLSKLFRLIAIILLLLLVAEIVTGFTTQGSAAIPTLLGEASRLIVLAGALWGVGDLAILMIDVGHDVRAARVYMSRQTSTAAGPDRERPGNSTITSRSA